MASISYKKIKEENEKKLLLFLKKQENELNTREKKENKE